MTAGAGELPENDVERVEVLMLATAVKTEGREQRQEM